MRFLYALVYMATGLAALGAFGVQTGFILASVGCRLVSFL